ncbi:hypothetical protein, partial [Paenibacillus zanthoxyli]|uniref:hypothetical protein n=1 Tax=Paenibacillus zanthoxyli TaxID=369399 RepID=UPI001E446D69
YFSTTNFGFEPLFLIKKVRIPTKRVSQAYELLIVSLYRQFDLRKYCTFSAGFLLHFHFKTYSTAFCISMRPAGHVLKSLK